METMTRKISWKSVKNELPKKAGHYLVVADWMGVIEKGEFDTRKKTWDCPFGGNSITHWMELPDPPDESNAPLMSKI